MARLASLDAVRGFTVAGMILVNNGYGDSFMPLRHAAWNGLSLSDLVFPFFLFIMGVSLYLSLSGRGFDFTADKFRKIVKRTVILFALGIAVNWIDMAIGGGALKFGELRFWAVLQRIALCYFLAAVFALTVNRRYTLPVAIGLLTVYTVILVLGNGYADSKMHNVLYKVDAWMLGDAHLYHKSAVDPEGLLGTISALANVLFGFYCGMKIKESASDGSLARKTMSVLVAGALLVFAGYLVSFALPYNKRIWSPSFAFITSGYCALLLGVAMRFIDMGYTGDKAAVVFFRAFGVNALVLYVASELMAIFFGHFGISAFIHSAVSAVIAWPKLASLCYALIFVLLNFLIALPLYRRKIYIKL